MPLEALTIDRRQVIARNSQGLRLIASNFQWWDQVKAYVEVWRGEARLFGDMIALLSGSSRLKFTRRLVADGILEREQSRSFDADLLQLKDLILSAAQKPEPKDEAPEVSDEDRVRAMAFLKNPSIAEEIVRDIESLGYVNEPINALMVYLVATSRKLASPLSAILKGSTAAGKSRIIKIVASMMPPEEIFDLSRMTDQALYYLQPGALRNKLIVVMEAEGMASDQAAYAVRTLQTERELTLLVPMLSPKTGRIRTHLLRVVGPIAFLMSTTKPHVHVDNESRAFTLSIDEGVQQTRRIMEVQRLRRSQIEPTHGSGGQEIIQKHRAAQRMIRGLPVVIPFARNLKFPEEPVRVRRDHEKMLDLIATVALLRQHQKEIGQGNGAEYVGADLEDYRIAHGLINAVLGQTLDEVSRRGRDLMRLILEMVQSKVDDHEFSEAAEPKEVEFTRKELRETCRWPDSTLHLHLKELERLEIVNVVEGGKGKKYVYTAAFDSEDLEPVIRELLKPEDLEGLLKERDAPIIEEGGSQNGAGPQ